MTNKKVKSSQKFFFEVIHYEDGSSEMIRDNNGFSVIEMIGITTIIQNDLMTVFKGAFKLPKKVTRTSTNSPLIHKK